MVRRIMSLTRVCVTYISRVGTGYRSYYNLRKYHTLATAIRHLVLTLKYLSLVFSSFCRNSLQRLHLFSDANLCRENDF